MANETSEPAAPDERPVLPRIHFHIVLGLILFPPLAAGTGWLMAVNDVLNAYATRAQRIWTRVLVALVLVDSLFVMGWIYQMSNQDEFKKLTTPPAISKVQYGIDFEGPDVDAPPVVERVHAEFPAFQGGLRPRDLIVSIDGTEVKTQGDVLELFAKSEAGAVQKFVVRSDGDDHELSIAPVARRRIELFQVFPEAKDRSRFPDLRPYLPALIAGALAWFIGRRWFGDRTWGWLVVLLVLAGSDLVSWGVARAIEASLGGASIGSFMIAGVANIATVLALTFVGWRLFRDPRVESLVETRRSSARAYWRGLFYGFTGVFRMGYLLILIDLIWFQSKGMSDPLRQMVEATHLGRTGSLLLILMTVVLAPIAEELLFRGFLLPRLLIQKGPVWAVGVTAVVFALLHPQYGLYMPIVLVYGVVLGWARVRTGRLVTPILLHMTVNGAVTTALLLNQ